MTSRNQRDVNEPEIVRALQAVGATVIRIDASGSHGMEGVPDLVVGFRGSNFFLEVKRFKGATKRDPIRDLTDTQRVFFRDWRGHASVVRTATEALRAIGAITGTESVALQ